MSKGKGGRKGSGLFRVVQHYKIQEIRKTLAAYGGVISVTLYDELGYTKDDALFNSDLLRSILNGDNETIVLLACGNIADYLQEYNINPINGVDEFKLIYFVGESIVQAVQRNGYNNSIVQLCKKVTRYSMIQMLDFLLTDCRTEKGRRSLLERVKAKIDNDEFLEHFGRYGVYLIYKTCSNTSKELRL